MSNAKEPHSYPKPYRALCVECKPKEEIMGCDSQFDETHNVVDYNSMKLATTAINTQCYQVKKEEPITLRPPLTAFEQDLRRMINKYSMENHSNTPDLILAEYLCSCLAAFDRATRQRETWYGRKTF